MGKQTTREAHLEPEGRRQKDVDVMLCHQRGTKRRWLKRWALTQVKGYGEGSKLPSRKRATRVC